ncbi:hypothetical protein [Actinokineospora sp. NBRC 105648]|uniref:hypothetical protein n=1 Tax=Actinokineospora sp. NBRC 105648 TaxID=3032206 RepID=UPI00249FE267|nr:hypothetical protein [Actinokineospora sp. NBRC 105648]GLZ37935.1 hypothetical protein Acsp05_15590 [Actinokineospora sp. NBRC 105648]
MSLVRHLVAPPAGRTSSAATDPLVFDLSVNPDPLRISPSSGPPAKADLMVVASLAGESPVECRSFTLTLRVGTGETDLASSLSGVTARISLEGWQGTVNATARTVTFAPAPGSPPQTVFDADTGVTLQVIGLPVNQRIGLSQVDVEASWRPPDTAAWQQQTARPQVGKFPLGFHLRSFVATPLSVPRGGAVKLRWDASAATHLALHYDGRTHPVTGETSVTITDITQTTAFHLRAVAQDGAGSVERTLSVMVHVPDFAQTVARIIVHGTLQAPEIKPVTASAPLVFPQRLPTIAGAVYDPATRTWEETHWSRSALPLRGTAMSQGPAMQNILGVAGRMVYQPLGSSGLVGSYFDGYAWTTVEEPFGPGADPALAWYGSRGLLQAMRCVYRGADNQVMQRAVSGSWWSEPEPVPGVITAQRPALASVLGQKLFLVYTDGHLNFATRRVDNWSTPRRISVAPASTGPPALAVLGNTVVCVYQTAAGYQVLYERSGSFTDNANWVAGPVVHAGAQGDGPPSLAVAHDRVHCVFRDATGTIQYLIYDGTSWTPASPVPGGGFGHSPSLALLKDRLCLF